MNKAGTGRDPEERAGGADWRASWFNRHLQIRLTPGHPESMHCQERFRDPHALHAVAVQSSRLPLEQQF